MSIYASPIYIKGHLFLTQRTTYAGHTVEEGLAGPLNVESHPVPETAHEADVRVFEVEDHHISAHSTIPGVALQHLTQLHSGQRVQFCVGITHLRARKTFASLKMCISLLQF